MKGFKKIIVSVLLVLTLCCAAVPGEARAEEYYTPLEVVDILGLTYSSQYQSYFEGDYDYYIFFILGDNVNVQFFNSSDFCKLRFNGSQFDFMSDDGRPVSRYGAELRGNSSLTHFSISSSSIGSISLFDYDFDLLYCNFPLIFTENSVEIPDNVDLNFSAQLVQPVVPQVSVPSLSGMTQSEASSALTAAGLVLGTVTEEDSTTVPSGQVIRQSVAADTSVDEGTVVDIVISAGLPQVTVPDLSGMTQSEASAALTAVGLVLGSVTEEDSTTVPSGQVISQSVAADSSILYGSVVDIVISAGLPQITVPSLVNMTQSQADTQLLSNGLVLGNVTEQNSSTVPAGQIISQSPASGSSVPYGTVVDIVISAGLPSVSVPDLTGMSQSQASSALSAAGLTLGTVTRQYSPTVPAGQIISQSLSSGASAVSGAVVNIVLSRGPSPTPIPVGTGNLVDMTATIMGMFWIFPLNIFLTVALLLLGVGLFRGLKSST